MLEDLAARSERHALAFLVLAAFLIFSHVGETHLANFDDCYYAQKAKEMLETGHWLTPQYAGTPRFDNPPLFLWLMALARAVLGGTNYAAILFSALSGVLCVALLPRLARRLGFDSFEAWSAAFVLLTTQYFLKYARHAMFDVFLTLLFLVVLERYLRVLEGEPRQWLAVGFVTGLGVLTKSVMGLFPFAVVVLHLLVTRRWAVLRRRWLWLGAAVCALTFLPWYLYQFASLGDRFLDEHVRWLLWQRAFHSKDGPISWSDYLVYPRRIATIYWPWLPLAAVGLYQATRAAFAPRSARRDAALLLLLWLCVVIGTMSLAKEKKLWYVMSAFPCLALLAAWGASHLIRRERTRTRIVAAGFATLGAAALLFNLGPLPGGKARRPDLQAMALVARAVVPAGQTVWNLNQDYWSISNQFLYYSDRPVSEPLGDPALLREKLDAGQFALIAAADYDAVTGGHAEGYPMVARASDLALIKAAPAVPALIEVGGRPRGAD